MEEWRGDARVQPRKGNCRTKKNYRINETKAEGYNCRYKTTTPFCLNTDIFFKMGDRLYILCLDNAIHYPSVLHYIPTLSGGTFCGSTGQLITIPV